MRLIIFDYDDTLFPSSFITEQDLCNTPIHSPDFYHHKSAFEEVESAAIFMLSTAISIGDLVVIVTNGKLDWIRYSMNMFYRNFNEFVRKNGTPIISAQDIFHLKTPNPAMWKICCFRQLVASLSSIDKSPTILVSVGDGSHESVACEVSAREAGIPFRNINLVDSPSPNQISQQLQILGQTFLTMVNPTDDLVNKYDATVVTNGRIEFRGKS